MLLEGQRPVMCYVTVTLMTFDKQSNGRRIGVE